MYERKEEPEASNAQTIRKRHDEQSFASRESQPGERKKMYLPQKGSHTIRLLHLYLSFTKHASSAGIKYSFLFKSYFGGNECDLCFKISIVEKYADVFCIMVKGLNPGLMSEYQGRPGTHS